MCIDEISAENSGSLLEQLGRIDISVPPRGNDRTTMHTERWGICRLLATLAHTNKLSYPCLLRKSERPDFKLTHGQIEVGVELTEAVNEDLARAETLPEAQNGVIDTSLFRWGRDSRTLDELRAIAGADRLNGPGWGGDSPENEFAAAIKDITERKTRNLNQAGYSRYGEDWLLVYENLHLPALDRLKASTLLGTALSAYWGAETFHRVFVESHEFIIELTPDRLCMHELHDMWHT